MADTLRLALLRAVNVGGRKVPMARLREIAEELGWSDVVTWIQSGNLVFRAKGRQPALETALENALREEFGFEVPALIRTGAEWSDIMEGNPLPEAAAEDPARLMLGLAKKPLASNCLADLRKVAGDVELVEQVGEALWIHFREGSARSRLTPRVLDRAAGSTVTTRNWRTVVRLGEMLSSTGSETR